MALLKLFPQCTINQKFAQGNHFPGNGDNEREERGGTS